MGDADAVESAKLRPDCPVVAKFSPRTAIGFREAYSIGVIGQAAKRRMRRPPPVRPLAGISITKTNASGAIS